MVMPHCMDFWSFQTPDKPNIKQPTAEGLYHHQTSADGSRKSPTFHINEERTFHCAQDVHALHRKVHTGEAGLAN